jgi:CheY-like chemotaxis protein
MGIATILVVDDNAPLLSLLRQVFLLTGYNVRTAESAFEALDLLVHENVDVIVTDLIMPSMGGGAFAAALRASGNDTPIIVMGGNVDETVRGAAAYLRKPFELREAERVIRAVIGAAQPPGSSRPLVA